MTRRRLPAVSFVLMALLGAAPWATAQGQLPTEVLSAAVLTPEQAKQIRDYISQHLLGLASEDKETIWRSRNAILDALRQRPSVQARQEISSTLTRKSGQLATLAELAGSPRDDVALNAVRVAGGVATPEAGEIVVKALSHQKPEVRLMAAAGLGRTFEALKESPPAVHVDGAISLVNALGRMVAAEAHPQALQTAIRSLTSAMSVTRPGFERLRAAAIATLAKEAGGRAAGLAAGRDGQVLLPALLLAGQAARDALAAVNDPQLRLDAAGTDQAVELSEQLIGLFMKRVKEFPQIAAGEPEAETQKKLELRVVPGAIIQVAESGAVLGMQTLGKRGVEAKNMAADFRKATKEGDEAFFRKALELVTALERR